MPVKVSVYAQLKLRKTMNSDFIIGQPIPVREDVDGKELRPIIMSRQRNVDFKRVATAGAIVGGLKEVIWREASSVCEDLEQEKKLAAESSGGKAENVEGFELGSVVEMLQVLE